MAQAMKKLSTHVLRNTCVDPLLSCNAYRASHFWSNVPMGPPDVILGISEAYKRDQDPKKVNLGVGAYRDDKGKPWVLPSVRMAEDSIHQKCLNHEYAPIGGEATYCKLVANLAFGDDAEPLKNKSNCTVQTLSGTGALRLGMEFIAKHYAKVKGIWMPNPTWGNHPQLCNTLNIPHKKYRYYDSKTHGFNLCGALEDICQIPEGGIILLHACAHNPTGVDPKPEEWRQLSQAIKERKLLPFFDMAYQGFATGSVDNDAFAVRQFMKDGHELLLAQSFAKNMGLYGERAGALTILCGDPESAAKVMSQVKIMIRTMYSNPPLYGSRLITEILSTPAMKQQWLKDVKQMADRIISMRKQLREGIEKHGNPNPWNHITDQIGMFCYTGLKPDEVERLTKEFHVYLTKDGRISVAGVSSNNVQYVAEAIHKVQTNREKSLR